MKIEIELKEDTVRKLEELAVYETTQRKLRGVDEFISVEDIIKASIYDYLTKVYSYGKITNENNLRDKNYQLKNRFKKIAEQEGIKPKDLSDITNIPSPNISRILNNKVQPSLDSFVKICIALKVYDVFSVLYRED